VALELEDYTEAIKQMRAYAFAYKGKRKEFFQQLYAMLATPIPDDESYPGNVKKMYLAAIGTLTSEIERPTVETYDQVIEKINSVLGNEKLGEVRIAIYPDEGHDDGYQIVGQERQSKVLDPHTYILREALPTKRATTPEEQQLVERFRKDLSVSERPFANRGRRD
jgi:uncharacterized protein (UPF0147 family)